MVGFSRVFRVVGGRGLAGRPAGRGQCGGTVEGRGQFVSPGPGRRYPQAQAAAAGEAGGDVQQPAAEFLRLGARQFAVQEEGAGPGGQVGRLEAEFEPDRVDAEAAGGETAEAGGLAAPDVVLGGGVPAVADLRVSGGTTSGAGGVGGEHLVP